MSVYEDEQATEEEVASAQEELQNAIDQMLASSGGTEDLEQGTDGFSTDDMTAGGQTVSGSGNGGSTGTTGSSSTSGSKTAASGSKAAKTGDSMMPIAGSMTVMVLTAAAAVLAWSKKREI